MVDHELCILTPCGYVHLPRPCPACFFSAALAQNHSLVVLELGGNSIGDRAGKALGECLADNDTLEGLSLFQNALLATGAKVCGREVNIFPTAID